MPRGDERFYRLTPLDPPDVATPTPRGAFAHFRRDFFKILSICLDYQEELVVIVTAAVGSPLRFPSSLLEQLSTCFAHTLDSSRSCFHLVFSLEENVHYFS